MGVLEFQRGRHEEACRLIDKALEIDGTRPEAFANYARILNALKRHAEALACCDKAAALEPDYLELLTHRGNALRGLGRPQEALATRIVAKGEGLPSFDCHCPFLSLPLAFKTTPATIPADGPYLAAPSERVSHWQGRMPGGRFRVGIAWTGNPLHRYDRNRSLDLARFATALTVPGVALVTLNPSLTSQDVATLRSFPSIVHLASQFRDLADTAAVIASLDLVITVDTAVAHLAGAMGKPLWILLCSAPDWRWMLGREDSPWYPTARLFRQASFGDWAGVLERVRGALTTVTQA